MDPLSLAWQAPTECPTRASVTRAVEKLITKPPGRTLEASSVVSKVGARYAAEIRTPSGERSLEGESCRAVSEAVAMVLALAIDPDATSSDAAFAAFDEPDAAPEAKSPPEPAPPRPAPVAAEPTDAPDRARTVPATSTRPPAAAPTVRLVAGLYGLVEAGMLPETTFGVSGALGISRKPWSAELGPMLLLPRSGELDSDPSKGGEIDYVGGYAAGCLAPFDSRRLDICGAFEVGRLAGTGTGVSQEITGEALWMAPVLFGTGRLPVVGPFEGQARLGVAVALNRPEFVLDELGSVHRPALVSLRGSLGFSVR